MNLSGKLLIVLAAVVAVTVHGATTINPINRYAYGANIGWANWVGDTNNGAVIGDYVCSGYIYFANVGWVSLGNGSPTNGIRYQNLSSSDFGVNHDGLGNLRGYAYGGNIGWLNFENLGAPRVDLRTGALGGSVWSANCGWISLSNAFAYVQTDTVSPGVLDTNGLPIAWEMAYFGQTGISPIGDPDNDGMSNLQEYLAGTNPNDPADKLIITSHSFTNGGTSASITWKSVATRFYYIQGTTNALSPVWSDPGLGRISPDGVSTTRSFSGTGASMRVYRIHAVRPLVP